MQMRHFHPRPYLHFSACCVLQGAKGSSQDKLRLALVHLLAAEQAPSEAELQELSAALTGAGVADTTALTYVARLRRNRLIGSARPTQGERCCAVLCCAVKCGELSSDGSTPLVLQMSVWGLSGRYTRQA